MKKLLLLHLITFSFAVLAQQPAVNAEMSPAGVCSPNIISNQGPVTITCNTAIDQATAAKVVSLLNRILRDEGASSDEVKQKAGFNHGVFAIDREPEQASHHLRLRWQFFDRKPWRGCGIISEHVFRRPYRRSLSAHGLSEQLPAILGVACCLHRAKEVSPGMAHPAPVLRSCAFRYGPHG